MFQKFLKWLLGNGRIDTIQLPLKSTEVDFDLMAGFYHTFSDEDILDWNFWARKYGMHFTNLKKFNQRIIEDYFWDKLIERYAETVELIVGETIYIPSMEELTLHSFANHYPTETEVIDIYQSFRTTEADIILKVAYKRASGLIGKHYGTESLVFLSPNPDLIGASERNTEWVDAEIQYKVNWGADVWKCNIYMHDVIYDAGFEPDVMSNDHYITAGQLHLSEKFEALSVEEVQPGNLVQLFSGSGSNDSHNLILTTFICRKQQKATTEIWMFTALGAEVDTAAASVRIFEISISPSEKNYKVLDGSSEFIRFFKPKNSRHEIA